MIKLSDYIMQRLVEFGIRDVFMISGGGAMHLVDSVGKQKKLRFICTHHEQACAIAAEGYTRVSGKMCAVIVTSGPGGTNTLTGVIGQWLDSVPALYLSGQVKKETTIESCRSIGLRQLGDQEINIVDIVHPVTKYAEIVKNPDMIRYQLEKALHTARSGRPGPVWLDISLDVQAAMINENRLSGFSPEAPKIKLRHSKLTSRVKKVVYLLKNAKRPIFIAGQGIRIAGAQKDFLNLIEPTQIPVLVSFCGLDLIPSDHPLCAGRIGTVGTRFGNFALQNADLLISVGTRNNIRQVTYNWKSFARGAKKIIVDIDQAELKKPTVKPDIAICADARDFIIELEKQIAGESLPFWGGWLEWCAEKVKQYPVVLPEYQKNKKEVNLYCFIEVLTERLSPKAVVVAGNGSACVGLYQAGIVKRGQRMFWNSGCAAMGYDLPASIGASIALNKKQVVCLAGDGSIQMNIQELETIVYNKLPVKIFVLNNDGYLSIKQTQDSFFHGRYVACDSKSGVGLPDIIKVAKAYGIKTENIKNNRELKLKVDKVLNYSGPVLCEVLLQSAQKFMPRVSSKKEKSGKLVSKPLEDMYPFLSKKELLSNMIVKP